MFVFTLLSQFEPFKNLEWDYIEAHHNKGPMDDAGRPIKNQVCKEPNLGILNINTLQEFAAATQKLGLAISMSYIPESEMLE